MKRKPTLFESLIPIIAMLIIMGIGLVYDLYSQPLLILAGVITAIIGWRVGCTWDEMMKGMVEKITQALPATLILISVGMLIGTWMISGTVPMLIYYGMKIISPKFIASTAFLAAAVVSTVTGTSWGAVGTIGVALIGVAGGIGASMPLTAGAIVAGAYFGDKISPLSDTTNLAPMMAGSELYEHIKHMFYTTIPATILSLIIYTIVGLNTSVATTTVTNPEKVEIMFKTLDTIYNWNIILLLPVAIVLYGSIAKKPTIPIMLLASATAGLIAVFMQGFTFSDVLAAMVNGFEVKMIKIDGFDSNNVIWEVTRLINRGGMMAMMKTVLIAYCGCAFSGIITQAGCLEVILENLLKFVKRDGDLILSTVLSCLTMGVVTGGSYSTIIIIGELFRDAYKQRGLHAKNLSRTLEDAGTVFVPLVPWSVAGVYMSSTLGVSVFEYAPWAMLCYLGFIFAVIYGYIGFGIAKLEEAEVKAA